MRPPGKPSGMRTLYTGLGIWNAMFLTAYAVFSVMHVEGGAGSERAWQLAGFFAACFCCVVQSLLIIHFIGSMKWIQQSGPTAGIEDTKPLRTAWIKGRMYPVITVAMCVQVAAAILAGGVRDGSVAPLVHYVLAFGNIALCLYGITLARVGLDENLDRMREVRGMMEERIETGVVQVEEDAAHLMPESERAAGKVLVFLSINVWVLYVYRRFILRDPGEPWWPYLALFVILGGLGLAMLARNKREDAAATPAAAGDGGPETA